MTEKKPFAEIVAEGEVECIYCDPTGRKGTTKDGVVVLAQGVETQVCWKHLQSVVRSQAAAVRKPEPATPQFPAMAGNGQD